MNSCLSTMELILLLILFILIYLLMGSSSQVALVQSGCLRENN